MVYDVQQQSEAKELKLSRATHPLLWRPKSAQANSPILQGGAAIWAVASWGKDGSYISLLGIVQCEFRVTQVLRARWYQC
jgi:hypothetical protein